MTANPVLWDLDARGVATVTLNRPEVNNAYDAGLINGVLAAMAELGKQPSLRVVVLKGNGRHFQAGADLKWINGVRPQSPAENEAVSQATFEAVQRLNLLPIPLLDGGHLMYYCAEILKGSPVSERAMELGQRVGIALLLVMMAFAFYNDLNRLLTG